MLQPKDTDWLNGFKKKKKKKPDPYIHCLQETRLRLMVTYKLKVRACEKIFHTNRNKKKVRTAIFISENK